MHYNTRLLLLIDIVAVSLAFMAGQSLRLAEFDGSLAAWWLNEGSFRIYGFLIVLAGIFFNYGFFYGHYTHRKPFWDELRDVWSVLLLLMAIDAAFFFFNKTNFSRLAFAVQWASLFVLLPSLRTAFKLWCLKRGLWQIPVRIIGNNTNAHEAWLALESEGLMGYVLQDVVITSSNAVVQWTSVPLLSWEEGLSANANVQVVIALEAEQQTELEEAVRHVSRFCPNMIIVPPTRGLPLWGLEPLHAFSHEVLLLRARNNLLRASSRILKRSFDLCVSITLLLLLSPLFAYLYYRIRQSGGTVFFGHQRISLSGQTFPCYKFRTMVPNAAEVLANILRDSAAAREEWAREFKLKDDPRITPIGHFLRKTSLDELPQLWNVLRGEMSLVGPRPVVEEELCKYGEDVDYYLHVKPGMTGLWQVSGRNDVDYETRVALDAWYVRNWSLWNDIVILVKTVRVVLKRDGAY